MGIVKIVQRRPKSNAGLKRTLKYVMRNDEENLLCAVTGPYAYDGVNSQNIYNSFLDEKRMWNKIDGRQCTHSILSFHPNEIISNNEALCFAREFAEQHFDSFQTLIVLHEDRNHPHVHLITNSVSYIDGRKLHEERSDLFQMRRLNDELCEKYGLTVTEKGKTYEGEDRGEISTWNMSKHKVIEKGSDIQACFDAIQKALYSSKNKAEFIEILMQLGWHTNWSDKRKHIVFYNDWGRKFRDSNISKTFSREISKEELIRKFNENRNKKDNSMEVTPGIEHTNKQIENIHEVPTRKYVTRKKLYFEQDYNKKEVISKER